MDMKNKVCLITGATSGIGKATAIALASMGATVVFNTRNKEKGEQAKKEIINSSENKNINVIECDLASFKSIRKFASVFKKKYKHLDILINNAGVWETNRHLSKDGIEYTFAVNYLAPFLLTNLLLDLIIKSKARIINVSSGLHSKGHIDFDDLESKKKFNAMQVYSNTKLANVLFTKELSRKLKGKGVIVNCLHPGVVKTNIARNSNAAMKAMFHVVGISPVKGAQTSVYLATSDDVSNITGKYFDKSKETASSPESNDQVVAKKLWEISEKYIKV